MKKALKILSVSIFALFVTLLLLETLFRLVIRTKPVNPLYVSDPILSWRLKPKMQLESKTKEGISYQIRTNEVGIRSRSGVDEAITSSQHPTIMVLGDSIVFGPGVDYEDTFCALVERTMQKEHPDLAVWNLGVGGYTISQEYLLLKELLGKMRPIGVMLCIYAENDFADLWYQVIASDKTGEPLAVYTNFPTNEAYRNEEADEPMHPARFLKSLRFLTYRLRVACFYLQELRLPDKWLPYYSNTPDFLVRYSLSVFKQCLTRLKKLSDLHQFELTVVLIPSPLELSTIYRSSYSQDETPLDPARIVSSPQHYMMETCRSLGIRSVDTTPQLKKQHVDELFFPKDRHLNKYGHERLSSILLEKVAVTGVE